MRFLPVSIVGLVIAASTPAVSGKHVDIKCNTVDVGGTRTKTMYLPTHTGHKTTIVRPIATVQKTYTPKPLTHTNVAVTIATRVVSAKARTSVVTSTSTKFKVKVPTSTVTVAPFAPTSTKYALLPATTTFSTTVTSYTAIASGPSLAPGVPRSVEDEEVSPMSRGQMLMNYDRYPGKNAGALPDPNSGRRARRGKQVFCTPRIEVKTTITKKARVTVTQTKRARRSTVTITSTATGTVTSTHYPKLVTSIVQKAATVTLTANTVTITATPTLAAVTVTKTLDVRADPPTETTVVDLYAICDPSRYYDHQGWITDASTPYQDSFFTGVTPDAPNCCHSIAISPASVTWRWVPDAPAGSLPGLCYGTGLNYVFRPTRENFEDQCVVDNPGTSIGIIPGSSQIGGLLQCGASTHTV
ncbi:hypothetical protein A4X09_0g4580 [Tilletia walkeri]|uniref:Ig-like domain-containing protein n=1 Tax=Tilletia walkeri TaxID=117179 RepID=A0A8X7N949_9BASI|nr:hypothetical protein A4X09_0g4580 [Tilletia walkeri]